MKASQTLKRQIIIEIVALLFLVVATIYSFITIRNSEENKISSTDGLVSVVDDTDMDAPEIKSDGEGLNGKGTKFTITNNNNKVKKFKIVIIPKVHNNKVISQIKIGIDDIHVKELKDLERDNGGYVLTTTSLSPGYTKTFLIKAWYKENTTEDVKDKKVTFDYKVVSLD